MTPLLAEFLETSTKRLDELKNECADAEGAMKQLAQWLAEKPTATTEELFRPLDEFVKALDKALQDNVRDCISVPRRTFDCIPRPRRISTMCARWRRGSAWWSLIAADCD